MIRLMMLIETRKGRWVEVVSLHPTAFREPEAAEDWIDLGCGGQVALPLADGEVVEVWRDQVLAVCAWREGNRDGMSG